MAGRPSDYTQEMVESGIYALSDDTGIRYVGQSKNIQKRFRQHCLFSNNKGNSYRANWIRGLLQKGKFPILSILELTGVLNDREKFHIERLSLQGVKLVNGNKGGEDMGHLLVAKEAKPWGRKYSPVQKRLKAIDETIRSSIRRGNLEWAEQMSVKLKIIQKKLLSKNIRDYVNNVLWERTDKYGST